MQQKVKIKTLVLKKLWNTRLQSEFELADSGIFDDGSEVIWEIWELAESVWVWFTTIFRNTKLDSSISKRALSFFALNLHKALRGDSTWRLARVSERELRYSNDWWSLLAMNSKLDSESQVRVQPLFILFKKIDFSNVKGAGDEYEFSNYIFLLLLSFGESIDY